MPDTSLPFRLYDRDENACDLSAASAPAAAANADAAAAAAAARVHQCDSLSFRAVVFGLGLGRHGIWEGAFVKGCKRPGPGLLFGNTTICPKW